MNENNSFLQQKYSHLFKILDFNHDGMIEESDFVSLGENIAIFRCLEDGSDIERFIHLRGKQIWSAISKFLEKNNMPWCNLENWIKFMESVFVNADPRILDIFTRKAVRDIFYIYDKNRDNVISKQEFMCFFVSLRVSIRDADECFRSLDLNGDLRLSQNELFLAIKQFFLSEVMGSPGNILFGNTEVFNFETRTSYLYA